MKLAITTTLQVIGASCFIAAALVNFWLQE